MNTNYKKLFSPIKINNLMIKNRIVATPTSHDFYDKAVGGAGIVICGNTIVEYGRSSFASPEEPYLFHKYKVEEAQQRIRECHAGGAKASLEIMHAGQYARVLDYAVGPMGFIREDGIEVKAMTLEMMEHTADCYASAVLDAKNLGFDIAFLHFGHGWLPAQFLSPLFNKREDEFGGSLENRSKFPRMILERIRKAVGPYYPLDMRISAVEWVEGSIEFQDTLAFIKSIEDLIDTVQISAGLDINHEGNVHCVPTNFKPHMPNAEYARQVREHVSIPVSVVGAVMSPADAEELLENNVVDLVAFGRSFIADPNWPRKALEGNEEDIVPCIRCNQCYHIASNRRNWGCSVNPRYRNESFIPKAPALANIHKKVVVVGGGVAGMKAAITADARGYEVILIEKQDYLGGAVHFVAKEFFKEDIRRYLVYLKGQLAKSTVDVRMKTTANPELIQSLNPDVLILATGANAITPPIPGVNRPHVINFYSAIEDEKNLENEIVIIGGGTIGAEIALEQAEVYHRNVTIVELSKEIAVQGNMLYRIALRQKMEVLSNLKILTETQCTEITEKAVIVKDKEQQVHHIPSDCVIIATGVRSDTKVTDEFFGTVPVIYTIGDSNSPRKIMEAVFEGYSIGNII